MGVPVTAKRSASEMLGPADGGVAVGGVGIGVGGAGVGAVQQAPVGTMAAPAMPVAKKRKK